MKTKSLTKSKLSMSIERAIISHFQSGNKQSAQSDNKVEIRGGNNNEKKEIKIYVIHNLNEFRFSKIV